MSDEATIYRDEPLQTYLDDAASGMPAPGGGSVSACAGALGAALVSMVCNLTIGKEKFAAVEPGSARSWRSPKPAAPSSSGSCRTTPPPTTA